MPSILTELARREMTDEDIDNIVSQVPEVSIYYCKLTKDNIRV